MKVGPIVKLDLFGTCILRVLHDRSRQLVRLVAKDSRNKQKPAPGAFLSLGLPRGILRKLSTFLRLHSLALNRIFNIPAKFGASY